MEKLIKGLRKFQTSYFCSHQELFGQLAQGQSPRVLFITCSDSRVDPNLIVNAEVGELFVIRNAGNMIPPYGATNGGEGAALEYALQALNIQQIIVCGHSNCGAMKGLLKLNELEEKMPLVYEWLKQGEATRRLIKENYSTVEGDELLDITTAENVLTQIENLRTYPIVHSRIRQAKLSLHAWVYHINTGSVYAYDPVRHAYTAPSSPLEALDPEALLSDRAQLSSLEPIPEHYKPKAAACPMPSESSRSPNNGSSAGTWLSAEQAERIYRGSC
ncbi:carbonic anhydrase [Oscillatoria sp. FACHB-1406]|uniref:carbonic anhydrase n=1 Tax=Oscillatoria sp. FACHB-1406 TaxID=2692846 RepID=UPI001686299E|nr:carbonic anhydrase [Oscillatoria sp. FACHB-1406]MBD2576944.1 carbonic anhydrase [Oscillatoria sp. FACHB-1406]